MHLREVLDLAESDELDISRPLQVGPLELGVEAAVEADRILAGGHFARAVQVEEATIVEPTYWSIEHRSAGPAEIFSLPRVLTRKLPTAIEVALVRTMAAAAPELHGTILAGDVAIALGPEDAWKTFQRIVSVLNQPLVGRSLLFSEATGVIVNEQSDTPLRTVTLQCLVSSFITKPLKFRFLELYRVLEASFLADIKYKLLSTFDKEPGSSLREAVNALKSEKNQLVGLAETQQNAFEACWQALHSLKATNHFAAALFRRLTKEGASRDGARWKTGAALLYQIRCAIVHAGERDLIFENFDGGDLAIEAVIAPLERIALLLLGIELT